jgi:hypothetical protein
MEAYRPSVGMLPVAVGGLAGHVFPPAGGRFVGGCAGFARLVELKDPFVGGCVGHASLPVDRRFVGGCAGFARLAAHHAKPRSDRDDRAIRETSTRWSEEALEASPA